MINAEDLLILDCEASGISEESYPISIGVSGAHAQSWFWMICPLEDWDHWDIFAEAVHGIERERVLQQGRDAFLVAREMNAVFKGKALYADSKWDAFWINKLFDDSGVKMSFSIALLENALAADDRAEYEEWVEATQMSHHPVQDAVKIRDYIIGKRVDLKTPCPTEDPSVPDQFPHSPSLF